MHEGSWQPTTKRSDRPGRSGLQRATAIEAHYIFHWRQTVRRLPITLAADGTCGSTPQKLLCLATGCTPQAASACLGLVDFTGSNFFVSFPISCTTSLRPITQAVSAMHK
jgi:hypothetical protein